MERSSNSAGERHPGTAGSPGGGRRFIVGLDRGAVAALGVGLVLYVMPFWREGRLRAAFWLTLVATLLHVYTSHRRSAADAPATPPPEGEGPGTGGAA